MLLLKAAKLVFFVAGSLQLIVESSSLLDDNKDQQQSVTKNGSVKGFFDHCCGAAALSCDNAGFFDGCNGRRGCNLACCDCDGGCHAGTVQDPYQPGAMFLGGILNGNRHSVEHQKKKLGKGAPSEESGECDCGKADLCICEREYEGVKYTGTMRHQMDGLYELFNLTIFADGKSLLAEDQQRFLLSQLWAQKEECESPAPTAKVKRCFRIDVSSKYCDRDSKPRSTFTGNVLLIPHDTVEVEKEIGSVPLFSFKIRMPDNPEEESEE